jgi:hypothetical protein
MKFMGVRSMRAGALLYVPEMKVNAASGLAAASCFSHGFILFIYEEGC